MISADAALAIISAVSHSTSKFVISLPFSGKIKPSSKLTDYLVSLRFPLKEEHRRHWIVNMGKDAEWAPSESSFLCSAHFTPDCFESESARLHSDAIPTVFNLTESKVSLYMTDF